MNDQPPPSKFKLSGAPPTDMTGFRRLSPWARVMMTGGALTAVALYGLQVGLPDRWRPASVAGDAAGDTVRHEIDAMKEAKIDMERRIEDAKAQSNAKAQADLAVINKALEERTASQAPVSTLAGLADVLCLGSQVVAGLTEPQPFVHQSSDSFYNAAQHTRAATCGQGDKLREQITASQIQAVQAAAAARGAPLVNGAQPGLTVAAPATAPAPMPVVAPPRALPQTLDEVYAISEASRHWPWAYVMKARDFIRTLPGPVQDRLFAGLDDRSGTGWDVLVDRVQAYQALPDAPLATSPSEPAPVAQPAPADQPVAAPPRSVSRQAQLRLFSYRMPPSELERINRGLDLHNGYPAAWYARVAAYQNTHAAN